MKRKNVIFILIIITVIIYSSNILSKKIINNKVETKYSNEINDWITLRDSLQKVMFNKLNFNKDETLFSETVDSLKLQSLFKSEFCILFLVPHNTCGSCLESEIRNINNWHNMFPELPIKVITKFEYKKDLRNFREFNSLNQFEVVSAGNINFGIEDLSVQTPIYIILNKELLVKEIFIPNPKISELTIQFFDYLGKKYPDL